ncbi:uncharacterized protein [Watersipora subatra]|uniref:uncharacterized protein n=1 Tax=Watersipora subatra TaxID=2589382 RepID=UPI00355BC3E8
MDNAGNSIPDVDNTAVDSSVVVVGVTTDANPATQQNAAEPVAAEADKGKCVCCSSRGTFCMKFRSCLESSYFSFTLGGLLFLSGIALTAVAVREEGGSYTLVGPFFIAAGCILCIKGCVNKISKRQLRREQEEQAERAVTRALTRAQRSQRNEQLALSQENLIIPPDYFESVEPAKTVPHAPAHRQLVSAESQTNFDLTEVRNDRHPHRGLQRLTSVQSQTSFPSVVSIGVDTSDLPVQLDAVSQAPPSYERAITRQESVTASEAQPTNVTYYIPEEEDLSTFADFHASTSHSTTTRDVGT